jgi:ATP synthase I chain
MKETADSVVVEGSSTATKDPLETRVMRTMIAAVSLAVIISITFAPWRVTTGLLLGGLLSLLNHYWMRSSIAAVFDNALGQGNKPRLRLANYVLRYFVVVGVVFAAYQLNVVSLAATIAGLCSFVIAIFFEALREVYLTIIHRKGTD